MVRRRRIIKVVLLSAFFVMGGLMVFFALAGLQTIEWSQNNGTPIPWQAWAMLGTVATWMVIAVNIPKKALKDIDQFFTKLDEEN